MNAGGGATALVLVVSDDRDAARFLSRLLDDAGFTTRVAAVDDIAIELASSVPPFAAVLGDRLDGAVVRSVRNLADPDRAATPIVVLGDYAPTGGNAEGDDASREVIEAGAERHLTRPQPEADLVKSIRSVIDPTVP